jgi:tetratricopeptide (TPR) repeat protein
LHEQGKLNDAIRHYRKAISLQENYANAYYNLHAVLINTDDMQPAIDSMKKVVELHPVDMDARFTLGVLLDYAGNSKTAQQQFEIVRKGPALFRARLDAWEYLVSEHCKTLPITGSMIDTFKLALNAANSEGLVLEFGVRFGNSIRQIAALVDSKQIVHGFDSFEGLPEIWHHEPKGSYTTKGEIPAVPSNVQLHAGWFEDTLPAFLAGHNGPVRLINIDCDIYSSTKTVLDLLSSRIVSGTVLIFDEYIGNEHWREDEFKAFQEAVIHYGWGYEYLCFSIFTKQVVVRIK